MRTTVDIPEHILRRAKATAALEGKSLKTFLIQAVSNELQRSAVKKTTRKRVSLPLVPSKHPGTLRLTAEKIALALNLEDLDVLAGH
jgi:hypothetical protein